MTRAEDIRGQTIQLGTECRLTAVLEGGELDLTVQATLTELDSGHPAGYAEHEIANARVRVRLDESSAVAMAAVGHQKRFVLLVRPSVVSEAELEQLLAGSDVPSPGATPSPVSTEPTSGAAADIPPRVNEGASEVDLVVLASAKDLIRPAGSGQAGHEAPVVARIEEAREGAPLPLPVIRTRTLTSRATIPNGHTLLLIEAAPNELVRDEAAPPRGVGAGQPASARRLLLLLTPTVVGPDGVSLGAPR